MEASWRPIWTPGGNDAGCIQFRCQESVQRTPASFSVAKSASIWRQSVSGRTFGALLHPFGRKQKVGDAREIINLDTESDGVAGTDNVKRPARKIARRFH